MTDGFQALRIVPAEEHSTTHGQGAYSPQSSPVSPDHKQFGRFCWNFTSTVGFVVPQPDIKVQRPGTSEAARVLD